MKLFDAADEYSYAVEVLPVCHWCNGRHVRAEGKKENRIWHKRNGISRDICSVNEEILLYIKAQTCVTGTSTTK